MTNSLKKWQWCIDFSNAPGQEDALIAPRLFISRSAARKENSKLFPKGRVIKIYPIREKK